MLRIRQDLFLTSVLQQVLCVPMFAFRSNYLVQTPWRSPQETHILATKGIHQRGRRYKQTAPVEDRACRREKKLSHVTYIFLTIKPNRRKRDGRPRLIAGTQRRSETVCVAAAPPSIQPFVCLCVKVCLALLLLLCCFCAWEEMLTDQKSKTKEKKKKPARKRLAAAKGPACRLKLEQPEE